MLPQSEQPKGILNRFHSLSLLFSIFHLFAPARSCPQHAHRESAATCCPCCSSEARMCSSSSCTLQMPRNCQLKRHRTAASTFAASIYVNDHQIRQFGQIISHFFVAGSLLCHFMARMACMHVCSSLKLFFVFGQLLSEFTFRLIWFKNVEPVQAFKFFGIGSTVSMFEIGSTVFKSKRSKTQEN